MWNHNKMFQHFIETAAIASLRWDIQMLIWCFSSQTYRKKTFVFQNNAKQSKLTALITITKTCSRHVLFLAQNVKNVRKFCMCICHLPLSCIVCTCSVKLWQIFKFGNFNKFFYLTRSRKKLQNLLPLGEWEFLKRERVSFLNDFGVFQKSYAVKYSSKM